MKINEILVEAPVVDPAALKAKQARTAAFNKSKQAQTATPAAQPVAQPTAQPVTPQAQPAPELDQAVASATTPQEPETDQYGQQATPKLDAATRAANATAGAIGSVANAIGNAPGKSYGSSFIQPKKTAAQAGTAAVASTAPATAPTIQPGIVAPENAKYLRTLAHNKVATRGTGTPEVDAVLTSAGMLKLKERKNMKVNEVLTEAPLDWNQGWAGVEAGMTSNKADAEQAQQTKRVVTTALQKWTALAQQIKAASGQEPTPQQATDWFTKFTGVAPTAAPANTTAATLNQWLTKEISNVMVQRAAGTAQAQPGQAQQGVPAQQGAQGQTQPGQAQPTAQPATAQAQPAASNSKIFSDPAAFKAEWDKYVASKSGTAPYQLISDPAMLAVLKDMWMRTGGTNLKESKKNTRKAA